MNLALFLLAVAGSGLVLTQSSLTAPLRRWLAQCATGRHDGSEDGPPIEYGGWPPEFRHRWYMARLAAKLVSCPMCAGFWLGLAWAYALGLREHLPAYGLAGSFASALGVALWLLVGEATAALGLWRYVATPSQEETTQPTTTLTYKTRGWTPDAEEFDKRTTLENYFVVAGIEIDGQRSGGGKMSITVVGNLRTVELLYANSVGFVVAK